MSSSFLEMPTTCQASTDPSSGSQHMKAWVRRMLTFRFPSMIPKSLCSSLIKYLQGIFQGRLVARTFLEHILATSSVEDHNRVLERPVGALIMSIQAVRCWLVRLKFKVLIYHVLLCRRSIAHFFTPSKALSNPPAPSPARFRKQTGVITTPSLHVAKGRSSVLRFS